MHQRLARGLRSLAICLGALALLDVALPFVIAGAWHLFRGSSLTCNEWKFSVPARWFAFTLQGRVAICRFSAGYYLWNSRAGLILLDPLQGRRTYHYGPFYSQLDAKFRQLASERGEVFKEARQLSVGSRAAYCWEFIKPTAKKERDRSSATCLVEDSPLVLNYFGAESFVPDFYFVVQSAAPTREQPQPLPPPGNAPIPG